jgi:DNA-binding NarL/FixJ family response regulator
MSIRILLADDHKIIRDGLRSLLEKQPDLEVVAEAGNGAKTVKLAQKLKPDVVIMDITMPDLNGIEATYQIMAELPNVKVIALSMHSDRRFVVGMLKAGASGYLLKDCAFDELIHTVHTVVSNRIYLTPGITDIVVDDYLRQMSTTNSSVTSVLTAREREVLQLLAEGKTTKQIADHLYLSVKTIETHRRQIMLKLDIHSIAELTKYAIREGLTPLET